MNYLNCITAVLLTFCLFSCSSSVKNEEFISVKNEEFILEGFFMLRECDTHSYLDIGLEKLAKSTDAVLTERDSTAFTWRHINVETNRNEDGSSTWNVLYLNNEDYETHFENLDLDSLSTTEYFLKFKVKKYAPPEFKVLEVLKVEKRKGETSTLICVRRYRKSVFNQST